VFYGAPGRPAKISTSGENVSYEQPLTDGWTLALAGGADQPGTEIPTDIPAGGSAGTVPATVPGCVHTDLLAAGLIPDPYLDDNEDRLRWIGRADWRYATGFEWTDGAAERIDLVCDGLDTVATIGLNGTDVGRSENMHRGVRVDLRPAIRAGGNDLTVDFASPYRYAEAVRDAVGGDLPSAVPEPISFIRKMACNFGWDWGPTLVTSGIWRPIRLHAWDTARLAEVRPLVTVAHDAGRVEVHVEVERSGVGEEGDLTVRATVDDAAGDVTIPAGSNHAVLYLAVDSPDLWWPRGYGEQNRYDLQVELIAADRSLEQWTRRIGFRDVTLDTTPDEHGSRFVIRVNDVPIFARGANWIPDDCFVSRVDRSRYAERLDQATDAGINFLRVWGGGIYENDDFYDLCDERGILVWQDFLFACAAYPEEQPIAAQVEAEARDNVVRLMPHPSLVLWNGNNENIWGWYDWGWQKTLGDRTWGKSYYLDLLPKVVADLDPTRPYWPGSPYSGDFERHPNDDNYGVKHIWDVWNARDYTAYADYIPRFAAEFGFQGPPTWATLTRAVHDHPIAPDSPGVLHHQKAVEGNDKLARGLAPHFAPPADVDDWHWLTQLNQARAVAFGIEHFRSHSPRCMGTVVWQLNDCWPVTSWAAIDGDARRKPLWYALRRVYADRLLTVQPRDGGLAVIAVNDSPEPWSGQLQLTRRSVAGEALAQATVALSAGPRETVTVPIPDDVAQAGRPAQELLVADTDGVRTVRFYVEDKDLAAPQPDYKASASRVDDGYEVTVTATTLLRDVALFPDRLAPDAVVDDMLVTLLPGESATFAVRTAEVLDEDALLAAPVLRCVGNTG
jgi:beta-mannosidase